MPVFQADGSDCAKVWEMLAVVMVKMVRLALRLDIEGA